MDRNSDRLFKRRELERQKKAVEKAELAALAVKRARILNGVRMTTPVVVNKRRACGEHVDITRASEWGNPFVIGPDGSREQVVSKYRTYLKNNAALMGKLHTLEGKRLGCICHPLPCHGDVLVEVFEETFNTI